MNFLDNDEQPGSLYSRQMRKNLDEVTLEDVANLDCITICCDEPVRQVPDTSRLSTILDISPFKPFKPMSRREERAAKALETPPKPPTSRRLPFSSRRSTITIKKGETQSLKSHTVEDLEKDYYKSLLDINGKFQKYVPKMACQGDSLAVEFRLQLAEGKIWRTFLIDAGANFYHLRRALLDMVGWREDTSWSFMYVSRDNKVCMIGQTGPLKTDEDIRSEEQLVIIETLNENYCKFCFIYDLQARWKIEILLTKVVDKTQGMLLPVCVRGKGSLTFPSVTSPAKLDKICAALKDAESPKRSKYLAKYGDLLSQTQVANTPFPSFYSQNQVPSPAPAPKKKRKTTAEGPIIVTIDLEQADKSLCF